MNFREWSNLSCNFSNIIYRWEMRRDPRGRVYYVDHNTRTTTWQRPTADMLEAHELWQSNRDQAMHQWEQRYLLQVGFMLYVNLHELCETHYSLPLLLGDCTKVFYQWLESAFFRNCKAPIRKSLQLLMKKVANKYARYQNFGIKRVTFRIPSSLKLSHCEKIVFSGSKKCY